MGSGALSHGELLQLKRWNTPTVYNGWELITRRAVTENFNLEETRDFMPQMGSMVGYAVTVVIEPSNAAHRSDMEKWTEYRRYVAGVPGPKIVVVQDLDKPQVIGSFWGEVAANLHRALGCVGTITDGAIRDLDEMCNAGFKAIARRLCIGHAHVIPVRWNCEVEVFGCKVKPNQLLHADKHGFLAVPEEDEKRLVEATAFMDADECSTVIQTARSSNGKSLDQIILDMKEASGEFRRTAARQYGSKGEW